MEKRLKLHQELCDILGSDKVYYQPPETFKLSYPCIIYSREPDDILRADDLNYRKIRRYEVILVYTDPDSELVDDILDSFQLCSLEQIYTSDNLYHASYRLYY